jgi:hypothetical protein
MGAVSAADLAAAGGATGVLLDTATGGFRFLGAGYKTNGVTLTLSQPLTTNLWAALEYENGAALSARGVTANSLQQVAEKLQPEMAAAATASLKGHVTRTGTKLRASYRWQPSHLVTAVGPYDAFNDQAYLSFYVRQAVRWGNRLPPGIEATIDVTNLLAEGYQPFLSADGRTLFLAQTPRTLQAGLSFTFYRAGVSYFAGKSHPSATWRYVGSKPSLRAASSILSNCRLMVAPAFCVTSSSMGRSKSSAP